MAPQRLASPTLDARRSLIWVRRPELILLILVLVLPPLIAWVDFLAVGLPPTAGNADPANPHGPHQFPIWIRAWHYLNQLLLVLLTVSGWKIFRNHPRLSWTGPGPEAEWLRIPQQGDPAEHSNPADADLGLVRYRHALMAVAWAVAGWIYLGLVCLTGEREHLLPTTWQVFPEAFHVFVQYSTFHLPLDPDGFYRYNSLQLLSYAIVMGGIVPLIALTGLAISPAVGGPFGKLRRLFGNVEAARSIHYLAILAYFAFIAVHVGFVVMYACWLNLNHIVLGTDETGLPGWAIGAAGIGGIALAVFATRRRPV